MNNEYIAPEFNKKSFHCPLCEAFAHQTWERWFSGEDIHMARCTHCERYSIWHNEKMIYPQQVNAPLPSENMPENVKETYEEARTISTLSPRATVALLRVALEELTIHLGETEGKLNTRIHNLKAKGLPEKVIKAADTVRIVGNEGAHIGTISSASEDDGDIVNKLFFLINFIVEKVITDEKRVEEAFGNLPEDKKDGIDNRDKTLASEKETST